MSFAQLIEAKIDVAGAGDNVLVAGLPGRRIGVCGIFFVLGGDVNVTLKDGATALTGAIPMKANGSFVLDPNEHPWFTTTPGNDFILNLSGVAQTSGRLYYRLAP
jgi:hypothetical protein